MKDNEIIHILFLMHYLWPNASYTEYSLIGTFLKRRDDKKKKKLYIKDKTSKRLSHSSLEKRADNLGYMN
jgi:hypothetical protein